METSGGGRGLWLLPLLAKHAGPLWSERWRSECEHFQAPAKATWFPSSSAVAGENRQIPQNPRKDSTGRNSLSEPSERHEMDFSEGTQATCSTLLPPFVAHIFSSACLQQGFSKEHTHTHTLNSRRRYCSNNALNSLVVKQLLLQPVRRFDPPDEREVVWNDVITSRPGAEQEMARLKQLRSSCLTKSLPPLLLNVTVGAGGTNNCCFLIGGFFQVRSMLAPFCVQKKRKRKRARKQGAPNKGTERWNIHLHPQSPLEVQ